MRTLDTGQDRHFPFVCIEGIDGTGKTTTARLVSTAIGGRYYKTPSGPHAGIRAEIDQKADPLARFYFYLSSVCHAAREIQTLLISGPVVCDRYIYSTYAYHFAMDENLRSCAMPIPLLMPSLPVLLTVNEAARLARLRNRLDQETHSDLTIESNSDFLARVQQEFRSMRMLTIDTSQKPPEQIATEVVAALSRVSTIGARCLEVGA